MLSHRPHGGTYDKSNNFLGLKGVLCNVCYVVIVNIHVVSMILHKINILFEILKFTLRYKILILVAVERYAYQDLFMKKLDLVKLM